MKKHLTLLLLFFALIYNCEAQNQNAVWAFGDSAGIDFGNAGNPVPINTSLVGRGSCTSISDPSGSLLFYAATQGENGSDYATAIWNKNHQIMQNGDSIIGEAWYNELMIVPFPGDTSNYYLFSIGGLAGSSSNGLYYSMIDVSQNGGLGKIMQKNIQLLSNVMADCLTAIKHGNGRDWWVIVKQGAPPITFLNRFYVFLVTPAGVSSPIIQDFNNAVDGGFQKLTFNSGVSKLMQIITVGFMCEYDFDRCTGIISNPNEIFTGQTSNYSRIFWEGAYSPNDSLFYVSTTWYNSTISDTSRLLQYNLFAPDIPASCDTLFETPRPILSGAVRLGPDNKIYYSCAYEWDFVLFPYPDTVRNVYNENLSVVNDPDVDGIGCNFQPFSFYLGGKRTYWGLPNNPNYGLGPLAGSICDTLSTNIAAIEVEPSLHVFYHAGWQTLFINADKLKGGNCTLQVFDLSGRKVYDYNSVTSSPYFTQSVSANAWGEGIYLVSLITDREKMTGKVLVNR